MVSGESDNTATFLVSRLWASFPRKKPGKSVKPQSTKQPLKSSDSEDDSKDDSEGHSEDESKDDSEGHSEDDSRGDPHDEHDKSCSGGLPGLLSDHDIRFWEDTECYWESWRASDIGFAEIGEFSFFEKTVDTIAQCERGNRELSSCQIKMARTLAHCFPKDRVIMKKSYFQARFTRKVDRWHTFSPLSSKFSFVFYEYLKGNRKLKELVWEVSAAAALADVLKTSHSLTHLHLTTGRCITSLTQALQVNHTVTHLNMREAKVDDAQAKAIGEILQSNHTLTHLCLACNKVTSIGVEALADALRSNKILENLHIGNNNIGDEGAKALGKVLQSNHTLTHLYIAANQMTHIGVEALAEALKSNKTLKGLDIANNDIGDEGAEALGKALQSNHTMTHLYIAHRQTLGCRGWICSSHCHHIGDQGVRAIAHALRYKSSLTLLTLCVNTLSDSSFAALGEALQSNCSLTHLYMQGDGPNLYHFGDSSLETFSKALKSRGTQMTHLHLSNLSISSSHVISLAEALRVNATLKLLDLSCNKIDCSGARTLAQALKKNQSLICLKLGDNNISDAGAENFVEVLQCNKTLMILDLTNNCMTRPGTDLFGGLGGHLVETGNSFYGHGTRWSRR